MTTSSPATTMPDHSDDERPVDDLRDAQQRFVSLWGRMASTWGISRTMAEVHAYLFIGGRPCSADDVMGALGISRGNASMTLRRLEEWELVTRVHRRGDRKEYFEAEQDVWSMFRTILAQRKKRELDPLLQALGDCRLGPAGDGGPGSDGMASPPPTHDGSAASAASAASPAADGTSEHDGAATNATADHDRRIDELTEFLTLADTICRQLFGEDTDGETVAARLLESSP